MNRDVLRSHLGLEPSATDAEIVAFARAERARLERLAAAAHSAEAARAHRESQRELDALLSAAGLSTTSTPTPSGSALSQTMLRDLPGVTPAKSLSDTPGESPGMRVPVEPGRVLAGRYEVRRLLGAGGMGAVFAALDRTRREEIAIKVILPRLVEKPEARERFLQEAKVATSLSHPGIVRSYDVAQDGELLFLTMELLEGKTLRERIEARKQAGKPFTLEEVRAIGLALCESLGHAHQKTVHRDVKPENVFTCSDGRILLMDFGIARLLNQSQLTMTGATLGTAYYMAPEQLTGGRAVDHRADQFAVCALLYELLTGRVPAGMITPIRRLRADVPAPMEAAMLRGLAPEPHERHLDMAALAIALASKKQSAAKLSPPVLIGIGGAGIAVLAALIAWSPLGAGLRSMLSSPDPLELLQQATELEQVLQPLRASRTSSASFASIDLCLKRARDSIAAGHNRSAAQDAGKALEMLRGLELEQRRWHEQDRAVLPADVGRATEAAVAVAAAAATRGAEGQVRQRLTNGIGQALIWCEPGTFMMGREGAEKARGDDELLHKVKLTRGFYLAETEVTQRQWTTVMGTEPWAGREYTIQSDAVAASYVSWNYAMLFCERLTVSEREAGRLPDGLVYRLPTEAEWEYACRGGSNTVYAFGDSDTELDEYAVFSNARGGKHAHAVMSRKPNRWGIFDMHGNVFEWCLDEVEWLGTTNTYYDNAEDPCNFGAPERVFRGGSWYGDAGFCRSAFRASDEPDTADFLVGFRPALAAPTAVELSKEAERRSRKRLTNGIGQVLIWCEPGSFTMGSPATEEYREDDEQLQTVELTTGFYLAETEVTQEQWTSVMGTQPWEGNGHTIQSDEAAASYLTWNDTMLFCERLSASERLAGRLPEGMVYRLPTEAEWEYACRAGSKTAYAFGGSASELERYAVFSKARDGEYSHPVQSREANRWGFFDMHGNVTEWCLDEVVWLHLPQRVFRGGSWSVSAQYCRSANRNAAVPSIAGSVVGFRPALAARVPPR